MSLAPIPGAQPWKVTRHPFVAGGYAVSRLNADGKRQSLLATIGECYQIQVFDTRAKAQAVAEIENRAAA